MISTWLSRLTDFKEVIISCFDSSSLTVIDFKDVQPLNAVLSTLISVELEKSKVINELQSIKQFGPIVLIFVPVNLTVFKFLSCSNNPFGKFVNEEQLVKLTVVKLVISDIIHAILLKPTNCSKLEKSTLENDKYAN